MKCCRRLVSVSMILLLAMLLPIAVFAKSSLLEGTYIFRLRNLPLGTEYVDLLIPLSEGDPAYTKLFREKLPETFGEDAQIVSWCEDGFRSYSLHYQGAKSITKVTEENEVHFFQNDLMTWEPGSGEHRSDIEHRGQTRLAMLDAHGNVLQVSSVLIPKSRSATNSLNGIFVYDAETDRFTILHTDDLGETIVYILFAFAGLVLTCIVEHLITIPFGLWKEYGSLVVKVNIVSQTSMHILHVLLYGLLFWRHQMSILLLEILIFVGEYLYYRRTMFNVMRTKCIWFVAAANSTSLICGLLFFWYFGIL